MKNPTTKKDLRFSNKASLKIQITAKNSSYLKAQKEIYAFKQEHTAKNALKIVGYRFK